MTTPSDLVLALDGVTRVYGTGDATVHALDGVDLSVRRGEFVALYGKSGAGKSTLINMITGIDIPSSGEVEVGGVSLQTMNADQLSRWRGENLGIVFQFFQLIPSLTLIENITLPMDFRGRYTLLEQEQRAIDLLGTVGIAEHAQKTPAKISGGQQQRVAIARALANDPEVIVADEPTGNLDSSTAMGIINVFSELVAMGKTVIVATHDDEIAHYATKIIEISDGNIVAVRKNGAKRNGRGN